MEVSDKSSLPRVRKSSAKVSSTFFQSAVSDRLLETAVAGLVWRKSVRQIRPSRPQTQNPQHVVQDFTRQASRSAASLDFIGFIKKRFNQRPLFIS